MSDRTRSATHGASRSGRPTAASASASARAASASTSASAASAAEAASAAPRGGRTDSRSSSSRAHPTLLRNQLIRRPTASSSNSAETLRLDGDDRSASDSSEIVVRNQHGEIEVENPTTPTVDDEEELAAMDYRQELEREKQRLAEAVKHHQAGDGSVSSYQSDELLEAVKASLRAKVAALAEDNWMFEPEDQARV